jgi:hypothetical protein
MQRDSHSDVSGVSEQVANHKMANYNHNYRNSDKSILDTQNEKFKLYPQKCFKVTGYNFHPQLGENGNQPETRIDAHSSKATASEYDAYLLIGQLVGRDLVDDMDASFPRQGTDHSMQSEQKQIRVYNYQPTTANDFNFENQSKYEMYDKNPSISMSNSNGFQKNTGIQEF